ncbi:SHOCT domain-containing protein [Mycobacterium vicinigordonae]|uniref:SHOCT domain-containing protein n=1 Tax=Mycobacterium vicinigordonae TaxID=1719132 RepID=A0A7D6E8S5_9MYCO|nr:SHOCT domain-containing protein [Mycobacterium vicinigordonae]QLL07605.1 SHOCT domain-containing protein [Mycobacterium vicinigordonae]
MQATVTPEAESALTEIAQRHGLSREAVLAMLFAIHTGGGTMAQFSIPELGGSGQWMRGGMTMVGNMFDNSLKARVDALCHELSQLISTTTVFRASATEKQAGFTSSNWWPADLGLPSSAGGQNDARYAVFPNTRRLAIQINGAVRVFDTDEHQITGVQQQQQGGGTGTVQFTSQFGTFDVSSLRELGAQQVAETPTAAPAPEPATPQQSQQRPAARSENDPAAIVAAIESLAGLHQRGILSEEEFAAKKAELLGRL